MVTLLKSLIIICSVVVFTYAASLAMHGNLEMEVIMNDVTNFKAFLTNLR